MNMHPGQRKEGSPRFCVRFVSCHFLAQVRCKMRWQHAHDHTRAVRAIDSLQIEQSYELLINCSVMVFASMLLSA